MDWQDFFRATTVAACLAALTTTGGCGRHAVKASDKAYLSDRSMAFDDDPMEAASDAQLERCREGSTSSTRSGGECR